MRLIAPMIAIVTLATAMPAAAYVDSNGVHHRDRHYGDRHYNSYNRGNSSYDHCRAEKSRAGKRGTVIGAVGGGAGTALLGGGVGGSLLGAGVGALAGNVIGRGTKSHC